jgi:uncharacterized protein (DUF1684 family)
VESQAPWRDTFPGRRWFPIQDRWLRTARFVRYDPPRSVRTENILGDSESAACPGYVDFDLGGTPARLLVTDADADGLFLIFADPTNGDTTYPAGRFLATGPVDGERVLLDFNCAYSPPCAFTPSPALPPIETGFPSIMLPRWTLTKGQRCAAHRELAQSLSAMLRCLTASSWVTTAEARKGVRRITP